MSRLERRRSTGVFRLHTLVLEQFLLIQQALLAISSPERMLSAKTRCSSLANRGPFPNHSPIALSRPSSATQCNPSSGFPLLSHSRTLAVRHRLPRRACRRKAVLGTDQGCHFFFSSMVAGTKETPATVPRESQKNGGRQCSILAALYGASSLLSPGRSEFSVYSLHLHQPRALLQDAVSAARYNPRRMKEPVPVYSPSKKDKKGER